MWFIFDNPGFRIAKYFAGRVANQNTLAKEDDYDLATLISLRAIDLLIM